MNRKRPFGSSGVLAALLIAPRSFAYCVCMGCLRDLFYTYPGEECPHCGAAVTAEAYVEGEMPGVDGHKIDFRSRSPLAPSPQPNAAQPSGTKTGTGRRRQSGKRGGGGCRSGDPGRRPRSCGRVGRDSAGVAG
jgi:hypothetical protein